MIMKMLTEKEYDALDELWTKTTPKTKANGTGFLSRRAIEQIGLDELSIDYLLTRAEATKKSPVQIIDELVREKIAASA